MPRSSNKLTDAAIKRKAWKPGCYADGLGLYLQVSPTTDPKTTTKSWLFRYMRTGKARKMGLGPLHTVSLAEARDKALQCRKLLLDNIDPIEGRKAKLAADRTLAARIVTFEECATKYIAAHEASWKNQKHRAQWPASLRSYAYPVIGALPVAEIDLALVLKVIEPIWHVKPETASRVRGRIETVLDWATTREFRKGDNPARWRGHLDNLLPARKKVRRVKHHAALPYVELPAFMKQLRDMEGVSARALEFAILTATRTSEAIGVGLSEIDFDNAMWIIPPKRIKAGREHRVPLSQRALDILAELPRERNNPHLFIGAKGGKPLSTMALLMTLRRMERSDLTVHGFRSTFRDWCAEQTGYPHELAEMALAHVVSDKTEAAYRRGDMLAKRKRLMADWAAYCQSKPKAGEVVALRGAK